MTLRQTKLVIRILFICTMVCSVLSYLVARGRPALSIVLIVVMIALCVAVVVVSYTFWRCPHCGKHLGRDTGKFCQHCGKELNMDL